MQRVLGKENGLTKSPKDKPIVVIGGGIGGLVSALEMASAGLQVILVEKEQKLGGKIRQIDCGGKGVDSGPRSLRCAGCSMASFKMRAVN